MIAFIALLAALAAAASVALAAVWTRRKARLRRLSGALLSRATFRGRQRELDVLQKRFEHLKNEGKANGAIIIAIHGMPGVGKSVLAQEFAQRLAPDYPDGQLYANLGSAGRIRAEADILNVFLTQLRPDEPVPRTTRARSAMFRSITANRRVLVILDAARDHEQVTRLVPTGAGCVVIVTSRRDLGPALGLHSFLLDVPGTDDALDILHALSHTPPEEDQKFALEIVDRLGRLPMALRAVGDEVLQSRGSLQDSARRLRTPMLLGAQGKFVEDRIESEYGRLTGVESRAYRLASLSESPSFAPWILVPLLELDLVEVEKIVSRLAVQQLLQPAGVDAATARVTSQATGVDVVTGLDRYRFHPVFRSFAERECERVESKADLAAWRMDDAYLELIDRMLVELDPSYTAGMSRSEMWADLPVMITEPLDRWVRAEYQNLLRCVKAAYYAGLDEMCWRIAAWLGGSVPRSVNRQTVLENLDIAHGVAVRLGSARGTAAVLLAKGGFLGRLSGYTPAATADGEADRVPGYAEALSALDDAAHIGNRMRSAPLQGAQLGSGTDAIHGAQLECEAHRRMAEAHIVAGFLRDAAYELERAAHLAQLCADPRRIALIDFMRSVVGARHDAPRWDTAWEADDELIYWNAHAEAEAARREQRWKDANDRLYALRQRFDDDSSRVSAILLRMAQLRLEQFQRSADGSADRSRKRAVHRAAEAVYRFQNLRDHLGEAKARCQLVRGLLAMGRVHEAQEHYVSAAGAAETLEPLLSHRLSPLQAMLRHTEGELCAALELTEKSQKALLTAAALYRLHGDQMGEASALAAAGRGDVPSAIFDQGRPGREPQAWLETGDRLIAVSRPVDIWFSIGPPRMTEDLPPAGGRSLDIVAMAGSAHVTPGVCRVRLDAWAELEPVRFHVVPQETGILQVQIQVYAGQGGSLLQKLELEPLHVMDAE
jgi:hypothetical protein